MFFSPSSLFLFSLCIVIVFSSSFRLQFSHQAPELADTRVSLKVNSELVSEASNVPYGTTVPYFNITPYQEPDEPVGVFSLLVVNSSTGENITQERSYVFESQNSSYFLINTQPNSEGQSNNTDLLEEDIFSVPEINYGFWRVANFAPVDQTFSLYVNGKQQPDFIWGSVSEYSPIPDGAAIFEVYTNPANKTPVVSQRIPITSGGVFTVVFNGEEDSFTISANLDENYYSVYNTCFVRIVNSVADANYNSLQPVFMPTGQVPFDPVGYAEVTEYYGMDDQNYTVYFPQDDEEYQSPGIVQIELDCESSQHYTLIYEGLPGSTLRVLRVSDSTPLAANSTIDDARAPPYNETALRLSLLSTSYYGESVTVLLNSRPYDDLTYNQSSMYYPLSEEKVNLTLVYNREEIFNSELVLSFGETYSYFISGLANSQTYPLRGTLSDDSSPEPTTTTTTSSTSSTTGSSDDDDLSGGEIAGIVIGVIVGVALLGGLIFCFIRRQRRSQFSTIG